MERIRRCIIGCLLVAALIAALVIPANAAHATSSYDNNLHTIDHLVLHNDGSTATVHSRDFSLEWSQAITDPTFWDAVNHGSWSVVYNGGHSVGGAQWDSYAVCWNSYSETGLRLDWTSYLSGYHIVIVEGQEACREFQLGDDGKAQYDGNNSYIYAGNGDTSVNGLYSYIFTGDPNYPPGYEGEFVNTTYVPPPVSYVAIGDSFSSGEGNPPFEGASDSDGCHRSSQAYPRLLDNDPNLNLGSMAFVACSGATTNDVVDGKNGELSQLDAITADTKVITITVGGDDINFGGYATTCAIVGPCGPGTTMYDNLLALASSPQLVVNLETLYDAVLAQATNDDAQVYIIDYPYIAPSSAGLCGGFDVSGAHSTQRVLNAAIAQAVSEVHNDKLHYVNTNAAWSSFEGKDLCGTNSDFNGLDLGNSQYSLHPNVQGQADYATVVKDTIEANS